MSSRPSRDELGRVRDYVPRVADAELEARLGATGAVLIEGPRLRQDGDGALRATGLASAAEIVDPIRWLMAEPG